MSRKLVKYLSEHLCNGRIMKCNKPDIEQRDSCNDIQDISVTGEN